MHPDHLHRSQQFQYRILKYHLAWTWEAHSQPQPGRCRFLPAQVIYRSIGPARPSWNWRRYCRRSCSIWRGIEPSRAWCHRIGLSIYSYKCPMPASIVHPNSTSLACLPMWSGLSPPHLGYSKCNPRWCMHRSQDSSRRGFQNYRYKSLMARHCWWRLSDSCYSTSMMSLIADLLRKMKALPFQGLREPWVRVMVYAFG